MASGALTLLQVNDVHGYLEPHPELVWHGAEARFPMLGGYARIAGYVEALRRERPVVLLDNGDTFHGTYPVVHSKGEALLPILNAIRFDAMTGHWDFAYGPPHLKALASKLSYPMLAVNCFDKDDGQLTFPPTRVVERGGLRVGIAGVAATIVDKTMPPQFSTGVRLTLGVEELPDHIARLREQEGVDLVVVLSHLGFPQDVKLACQVGGIDALLSGHTHNRLTEPVFVGSTPIIQSGCHGSFVGRLDLEVENGQVTSWLHELVAMDDTVPEDPSVQALVGAALAPHRSMLREIIGHTNIALHRNTMLDSPMDDVLLDAIAAAAGTELAFSNGWRYGAPVPPGPVTMEALWNIIPGNPPVSTVQLTGAEVVTMLEENLERTFAADPYEQMGGYVKRCHGLELHIKLENPSGHRIEHITVDGRPLRANDELSAAYVTLQGVPTKYGHERRNLDIKAVEALRTWIGDHVPGDQSHRGKIVVV